MPRPREALPTLHLDEFYDDNPLLLWVGDIARSYASLDLLTVQALCVKGQDGRIAPFGTKVQARERPRTRKRRLFFSWLEATAHSSHMAPKRRGTQQSTDGLSTNDLPVQQSAPATAPDYPQEWYYNDDHTDPVNFGFMFPVPRGGRDQSVPDVIPVGQIPEPRRWSGSTSSSSTQSYVPQQIPEATKFVKPPPAHDGIPGLHPHTVVDHRSLASGNAAYKTAAYHTILPFRSSPEPVIPTLFAEYSQHFDTTLLNPPLMEEGQRQPLAFRVAAPSFHDTAPVSDGSDCFLTAQDGQINENNYFSGPWLDPFQIPGVDSTTKIPEHQSSSKRKEISTSPLSRASSLSSSLGTSPFSGRPKFTSRKRGSPNVLRDNVYHIVDPSLCSRCQIYSESPGCAGLCNACMQATNFTTWPSVSGTRRESMESLVLYLLPAHMEDCVRPMPPGTPQPRSWRQLSTTLPTTSIDFSALVFQDQFILAKEQARSTGLFAEDIGDLMDIAQKYQRSLASPNTALEAACKTLTACCELYKKVVSVTRFSPSGSESISVPELLESIQIARSLMFKAFQELQDFALSPSHIRGRDAWLPSFLCACMIAASAIVFLDSVVVFPSPYKEQIWGIAWHNRLSEIRHGGYGMLINILNTNTMGVNPLKYDIWSDELVTNQYFAATSTQQPQQQVRGYDPYVVQGKRSLMDPNTLRMRTKHERDILLGASPAALQGLLALKAWQDRYNEHLQLGEDMFSKDLYSIASMKPMAGLWRVFEMK
ncbi:hypothetical protein BP5796_02799 [Coleophoma crateriformis]|uniref:Uncharacterized protein n=1 Tax=Coleophoma crateriformis TaxID=565419 RepID=A0A3D8SZB4_9HELO|nr:hypothetical protein BP5796_02799 [Coleophoma crateriformis]